MKKQNHLFSNHALRLLLVPLMVEQLFNSLMGTVDSMMVSNVGSAAISAVSLVDSINVLVIQAFCALAAGGTIICSQYIGQKQTDQAKESAGQLLFIVTVISLVVTVFCLLGRKPLLALIFGEVEKEVMDGAEIYFFFTALSFPFIALYDSGSAIFRAQEDTRTPMVIALISNGLNILGNAVLIWGFHLGVAGAAVATLGSRVFSALIVMAMLRNKRLRIAVRGYWKIRPDRKKIRMILRIGVPSGIENGMFQFGKLAIQSTVSTLGTTAIAAQAMASILESLNGVAAQGVGIGLMTVVGECLGAGRKDEAVYYVKKLTLIAEVAMIISCLTVFALTKPITILGGMEAESARLCIHMVFWITMIKPLFWVLSFVPGYGFRAAGDVRYSMIVSTMSMWICRVSLTIVLCRYFGFGPMGVWIGMFTDWFVRGIAFGIRFFSGKWLNQKVLS